MPPLKNLRQETFCLEWVKDRNGTRAFKAAGYTGSTENAVAAGACQVLKSIKVKARILELQKEIKRKEDRQLVKVEDKIAIDRAWVVNHLVENVERSMQAVPVLDKLGYPTGEWQYEGGVANRGLELIGKDLGMFLEKPDKGGDTYNTQFIFMMPMNDRDVNPEHQAHAIGNSHSNGHAPGS